MAKTNKRFRRTAGRPSVRRVPISRITRYFENAKAAFKEEGKLNTLIKNNDREIIELKKSSDLMSKTKISILELQNKENGKALVKAAARRTENQNKVQNAIDRNNSIDSARKAE